MTDASINASMTREEDASFGDYFALLKPRVMSLVVFTAFVGLMAAPMGVHPVVGFAAILFIAIGGGASGALNMWWDADIDQVMKRTKSRPIPAGKVDKGEALSLGLALSGMSVIMLALATNVFAGAFPPVIGWIAATGSMSIEPWLMFALTFLWTPPHFWALALFMRNDYDMADVPMLTVTHGRRSTRKHILAYTVILAIFALATAFTGVGGPIYLAIALVLNALFLKGAVQIWRRDEDICEMDNFKVERSFFKLSLLYLFLHFGAILMEALLKPYGLGGW